MADFEVEHKFIWKLILVIVSAVTVGHAAYATKKYLAGELSDVEVWQEVAAFLALSTYALLVYLLKIRKKAGG